MTELQREMITKIAMSEYSCVNGKTPNSKEEVGDIWADCIIEDSQDKGTFTSLLNAGMVYHTGKNDPDAGVGLTDKGLEEFKKIKVIA